MIALLIVPIVLGTTSASAGLLARTRSGSPVRWTQPEIVLVPITPAARTSVSAAKLRADLEKAAEAWNRALEHYRVPRVRIGETRAVAAVRQDGVSVVVIQASRWCPSDLRDEGDCYDKRRSAITHLYPVDAPGSARDGAIEEADIEVNGVDFDWKEEKDPSTSPRLRAVLVHELGHVLGLDHPCVPSPTARSQGPGLPSLQPCIEPASKLSIMYPDPIERGRPPVLVPGDDDEKTLGEVYPKRKRVWSCGIDGGHRCDGWALGAFLLSIVVLLRRAHVDRCV